MYERESSPQEVASRFLGSYHEPHSDRWNGGHCPIAQAFHFTSTVGVLPDGRTFVLGRLPGVDLHFDRSPTWRKRKKIKKLHGLCSRALIILGNTHASISIFTNRAAHHDGRDRRLLLRNRDGNYRRHPFHQLDGRTVYPGALSFSAHSA